MTGMDETRFEEVRAKIANLDRADHAEDRRTHWILDRVLGIARDRFGGYEIFLAGETPLEARSGLVRRHLKHGAWKAKDGDPFQASRVVLRSEPHFAAISATIAVELLRCGLTESGDAQAPFTEVEPIIEMALRRGALSEEQVIGVMGELMALEVMLRAVRDHPERRSQVLDTWRGHQQAARDFCFGEVAIEIKTTTTQSSSHHINSLAQIEPMQEEGERMLYLLSIGLIPVPHHGLSLPQKVNQLLGLLAEGPERNTLQDRFLEDLRAYGTGTTGGYVHDEMADWPAYAQGYQETFKPRLYDLMDTELRLISRADLNGTFVDDKQIEFGIHLDPELNSRNPLHDWEQALTDMTRECFKIAT